MLLKGSETLTGILLNCRFNCCNIHKMHKVSGCRYQGIYIYMRIKSRCYTKKVTCCIIHSTHVSDENAM